MCQRTWHNVNHTYLWAAVRIGLLFDWALGGDPVTPDPFFLPHPTYTSLDLH